MGRALADAYPEARAAFDEAEAALPGLTSIIFDGPDEELVLTQNAQPAILTVSIAAQRVLAARGIEPAYVAGHSLGEYSANVAAGTMAFGDAVKGARSSARRTSTARDRSSSRGPRRPSGARASARKRSAPGV